MRLLARIKSRREKRNLEDEKRNLEYAQDKLEGEPSPFREGAPEKSQSHSVDPTDTRFIP
jgi:hypothetical protein